MTLQQRTQAENRLLALTTFRESGGAVDLIYDDDVSQAPTRTLAIFGGPLTSTVTVSPGGPIARLQSAGDVSLIEAGFNRPPSAPTVSGVDVWEHAYFTFAEPVNVIVDGQTFTGDRISILMEAPSEPVAFVDVLFLNNKYPENMKILDTSFHLWGRTHTTLSDSFLTYTDLSSPLEMRGFGEPQTLASSMESCCTDEIHYDFPAPVQIGDLGDTIGVSGWYGCYTCTVSLASSSPSQEILLGKLEFLGGDTGTHEVVCATFPGATPAGDVHWLVRRDGQVILDTTLPDGECLNVGRPLAVTQIGWDLDNDGLFTISGSFRLMNINSVFEVQVAPAAGFVESINQSRLESSEQLLQLVIAPPSSR